ncbi:type II toxin-antitoxin system RelE/ParE family toxin [Blastococcus sp. Marseille-P5729]|uniref:type II toxin-antitoxin system RelE family toxin n=1 Tax=Blastococcus sp. Marseille-P5729 TaxID=2086582 RepID=UPI000D0E75BB|nr:type II toxin-antitoxin system RelE/ParE family toxin [Blastococcus sp. Marseille-P5729]
MSASVHWSPRAVRDLARLPLRVAAAVATYVDERLATNPLRLSKPLAGDLDGVRSARNGDYRVLFDYDEETESILIVRVGHRAHVYRT